MKRLHRYLAILFWIVSWGVLHGQTNSTFQLTETEESPSRSFKMERYENANDGIAQIWVVPNGKDKKYLLFEYSKPEAVCPLISHDDQWLVLNFREGSDSTRPILFQKNAQKRFQKSRVDLGSVVWHAAANHQGFSANAVFDHRYSKAVTWLGDSHTLMLHAWGHHSGEYYLDDWYCFYDVKTRQSTLDLNALNNGKYHLLKPNPKSGSTPVKKSGSHGVAEKKSVSVTNH